MEQKVVISICGTQKAPGEEPHVIELTTDGWMTTTDTELKISYQETEVTGMEGVTTSFVVMDDRIELQREGALTSTMVFIEGKKHESLYDLGFGAMLLGITPTTVTSSLTQEGGKLFVDYGVEVEHEWVGTNTYDITVQLNKNSSIPT